SQTVTVTIHGTNDVPVISGTATVAIAEDGALDSSRNLTACGTLTIVDVDQGQSNFAAQPSHAGSYGTFTLSAAGAWTYTADDSQGAVQQLGAADSLNLRSVPARRASDLSQTVTVTIHGTNDVPVISGTA